MARIRFPSYFPIGNCIKSSEQQSFGPETLHNTLATLEQIMEVYWRVKKWRIENTLLGLSVERYNWPTQDNPPDTEEKLVCGALSEFDPGNSYIGFDISSGELGSFGTILNGFLSVLGFVPAIYDIDKPINFYMGVYIELAYIAQDEPSIVYQGLSFNPLGFGAGGFKVPIKLSEATINVPMFYDASDPTYRPATHFKIEAIEWWPYEDEDGNAIYDTATGLPL